MMCCSFCGAGTSKETGHSYTERYISCRNCTTVFWKWVESHTNKKQSRRLKGPVTAESFYEAATNRFSSAKRNE
jgi:hypothetical protein